MGITRAIVGLICGAAIVAGGCRTDKPQTPEQAALKEAWPRESVQPVQHPTSVVVAEGPAPLVFQVREPTIAHILDMTSGLEIGSGPARRLELVYVSEKTGAFAGKVRLVAGPLPEGHRYAISVNVGSGAKWESKIKVLRRGPPSEAGVVERATQLQGR